MFIVSMETTGYKIVIDQSLALYVIYKHSPWATPSGVMLIYCIQTLGVVNNYYIQCMPLVDLATKVEILPILIGLQL